MGCDVEPDKFSTLQSDDDEDVEQVEANGRGNEQIHGGDVGRMVTQEGAPPRGGRSASLDHILRDAGLSDLKAELEQLAVDARRSPQRIVNAHPPDQRAQVRADLRPTSKGARFPSPVPAEAGSVPSHEGLGANNCDGPEDRRKPSIQLNKKQTITIREPDAATYLPPQYDELMSERSVFCLKSALRLERRDEQGQAEAAQRDHRRRR